MSSWAQDQAWTWPGRREPLRWPPFAARATESKDGTAIKVARRVGTCFVICDAFVLVTGRTERQVKALADEMKYQVTRKTGRTPGRSGARNPPVGVNRLRRRRHPHPNRGGPRLYRLERLWGRAPGRPRSVWRSSENVSAARAWCEVG
ncbi:MAG: RsfS/YbeB/iojap family protein [Candidatus Microthrix sp.]|nr:RsfS/YbeB/iojap family protein [Candidatus Microthrix sp.]